jgi:hypothetical protein
LLNINLVPILFMLHLKTIISIPYSYALPRLFNILMNILLYVWTDITLPLLQLELILLDPHIGLG